ncbi:MAG: hypothetical protein LBS99_00455 [Clostridiales bacterium]|jgi:DNA polymerase III alpha subunit (gram-positive type)|nr:hypothetical protein [Clostridiales bacterium]
MEKCNTQYTAFDIECARCYKNDTPICEFGYVVFDDSFDIIEKENIIINPKGKFKLTGRKGREDVILTYSKAHYKKQPYFYEYYQRIRDLLECPNRIILNHAVRHDIGYINFETKRYKLAPINFKAYDADIILKLYEAKTGEKMKWSYIEARFEGSGLMKHRAVDDAHLVMLCVQSVMTGLAISFQELTRNAPIENMDGEIVKPIPKTAR